jgi:hypothetical protein
MATSVVGCANCAKQYEISPWRMGEAMHEIACESVRFRRPEIHSGRAGYASDLLASRTANSYHCHLFFQTSQR